MGGHQVAIGLFVALVTASIACGSDEDLDAERKDTGPIAASDAGGAETPDARSRAADGAIVDAAPSRPVAWITDPATHVNTLVGTTNVRKNFPGANVFPGADFPFGMVQWSPDTAPTRPSGGGYDYKDSKLLGFSLTHISGPGCSGAMGDVPILPLTGALPAGDLDAFIQPSQRQGPRHKRRAVAFLSLRAHAKLRTSE